MLRILSFACAIAIATALLDRPIATSRRAVLLGVAASLPSGPARAEAPLADVYSEAADRIKSEGVLKSTGKQVPPALTAAIVFGAAAATASYFVFPAKDSDHPLPTGISRPREDEYEKSRWVNNVDLPWMDLGTADEMDEAAEPVDEAVAPDADESA